MTKSKQAIRAEVAARVKNLSPVYCREADEAIFRLILRWEVYREAETIFCFVGTEREIDTAQLIRRMLEEGKRVAVPLCTARGIMEARRIEGVGDLVSGKYGILAPRLTCPPVSPEELDLTLVPCCAASETGVRLGYGGGYYDRYLPRTKCPRVLLCRAQLLRGDIPAEPHDAAMDYLITERGLAKIYSHHS